MATTLKTIVNHACISIMPCVKAAAWWTTTRRATALSSARPNLTDQSYHYQPASRIYDVCHSFRHSPSTLHASWIRTCRFVYYNSFFLSAWLLRFFCTGTQRLDSMPTNKTANYAPWYNQLIYLHCSEKFRETDKNFRRPVSDVPVAPLAMELTHRRQS